MCGRAEMSARVGRGEIVGWWWMNVEGRNWDREEPFKLDSRKVVREMDSAGTERVSGNVDV